MTDKITKTPELRPAAGSGERAGVTTASGAAPASIAETGRGIDALSNPTCAENAQVPPAAIICAVTGDGEICPNTCAREGRCVWAPAVKESLTTDPPPCDVSLRNIRDGLREFAAEGREIVAKLEATPQDQSR